MSHVLLATDSDSIRDEVVAGLADPVTQVSRVHRGDEVLAAVEAIRPTLVILDMQIGNMGGIAACHTLRLEAGAERIDPVTVMLLLDRNDDRFLAETAKADGWLVKPIDAFRLRRAVRRLLTDEPVEAAPSALA